MVLALRIIAKLREQHRSITHILRWQCIIDLWKRLGLRKSSWILMGIGGEIQEKFSRAHVCSGISEKLSPQSWHPPTLAWPRNVSFSKFSTAAYHLHSISIVMIRTLTFKHNLWLRLEKIYGGKWKAKRCSIIKLTSLKNPAKLFKLNWRIKPLSENYFYSFNSS